MAVVVRMRAAAAVCVKTQDSASVGQRLSVSCAYAPVRVVAREAGLWRVWGTWRAHVSRSTCGCECERGQLWWRADQRGATSAVAASEAAVLTLRALTETSMVAATLVKTARGAAVWV